VVRTGKGGPPRKFSDPQETKICCRYSEGENTYELARRLATNLGTICQILERHGIARRSISEAKRTYHCDHSFFDEIDSECKAYWLGFIAADGCVYGNALQVTLSSKDRDHLFRPRADLQSDHPIKDNTAKDRAKSYAHTGSSSTFYLRSSRLTEGLARHSVMPRKTFKPDWPDFLPDGLLRHYLRGYSDGDGSFHVTSQSHLKRTGERLPALGWQIAGTEAFCRGAQEYLRRVVSVGETKVSPWRKDTSIFGLRYGGALQVSRIYDLLYKDATFYLPRKREVVRPHVRLDSALPYSATVNLSVLKTFRRTRGMTQQQFAAEAGINPFTVSGIETGKRPARTFTILKIAEALGVEPQILVIRVGEGFKEAA
jgi:DNA-binding XRE family transcriptional regulator